jgi:hypothetical protein
MGTAMRELRTAVMILVDVSWQSPSGSPQTTSARMEDRSPSGACIRIKTPIEVGAQLRVQWRFEQFSGVCKYCRREGYEYVVGIQRDANQSNANQRGTHQPDAVQGIVPRQTDQSAGPKGSASASAAAKVQSPQGQENNSGDSPPLPPAQERDPILHFVKPAASAAPRLVPKFVAPEIVARAAISPDSVAAGNLARSDEWDANRIARHRAFAARRPTPVRRQETPTRKEVRKERKFMGRNWLERAPWNNKQESPGVNAADSGDAKNHSGKENTEMSAPSPNFKLSPEPDSKTASFQVDLLPMEEVYRAAGVSTPAKGYSVHKVVEMLHSEHIKGLSPELKRAAVLMALDAAGVPLEQIQQDAKSRQEALDRYEAEQNKQAEAEWARRAEENAQIQAELERVKAHYMARINRNLEGVAREKAIFNEWVAKKKQESESMSEAVTLCAKAPAAKPAAPASPAPAAAAAPLALAAAAGTGTKPS